jgi:hypothetical protein
MSATLGIDSESKGSVAVLQNYYWKSNIPEQPLTFTVENNTIEISSNSENMLWHMLLVMNFKIG